MNGQKSLGLYTVTITVASKAMAEEIQYQIDGLDTLVAGHWNAVPEDGDLLVSEYKVYTKNGRLLGVVVDKGNYQTWRAHPDRSHPKHGLAAVFGGVAAAADWLAADWLLEHAE